MFALALPMVAVPAMTASAADWAISKVETSAGPYQPGQTITWVVTVSCSDPNQDPCTPTTMTDPLPEYVELVSASIQSPGAGTVNPQIDADTDTDTVTYTADSVNNGEQSQILITATVSDDIPYSQDGVPITNTATVESDNADPASASDDIVPEVPLVLDSETTKSIDPEGAIASPGTPATVTIGGTNTSNDPVDSLVIVEPTAGTDPNPFTYLGFTGWGAVSWPEGATSADVTFTCADGSTPTETTTTADTLPDPPAGCEVEGFTVEFDGDIAIGATASIPFDVEHTDAVTELTDPLTLTNTTASNVVHGDNESTPTDASDTYVITPPNNAVTPTKSFDPAVVSAGSPTTVTLGATNDGDPTTSMTITEPSPGTDSPFEGDDPLTFTGWGTDGAGAGVVWPNDADAASVTFTCADGTTTDPIPAEAEDTLPDPPAGCVVVGFSIEYTGNIVTGAEATIPFTADTDPDQAEDNVLHPNEITATIPNDSGTADATLETLTDRLATETTKSISPSTIPALPGQTVVVGLPTQLLPFGEDGSTTNADQVVIQDPTDTGAPGEFWGNFTASSVRSTDVPAGTELTINYWNGSEWVEAPDCGSPVEGAATVNCDLPDGAQGVQFVYDDTTGEGIPPGESFAPNFVATYDGPEDREDPIANCGASSASSDAVAPTDPAEGCDTVDPFPVPVGPGDLDFIDKTFLAPEGQSGEPYTLRARTQDEITAQITWSTNGFEGVDPMVISDIADPVAADDPAIAGSFYDAFNLVAIAADDPLLQYDQVESVELFINGAWVEASGDPCPEACDGTFPGYTLTAGEQESATSARLTYTESPGRAAFPTDPTVPAAGSGVARSTQADGRHVDFTFQLRDDRRSGGPALGEQQGEIYNNPDDPGLVTDTARGTATFQGTDRTDTDADDVLILDQPINVGITKDWTGGPLSVPPEGTPYEDFPTTVATITGSNNSVARVDQLRLAEPSYANDDLVVEPETEAGTNPFDAFMLTDIIEVAPPDGTETTTVTLTTEDGTTTDYDEAGAEALTAADLADVVGVEVTFDGRIASTESGNNEGVLEMQLKLLEFDRYTGERITVDHDPNPVPNSAGAEVSDPGGTTAQTPQAWDTAEMELRDAEITMEETKSFSPATIVEPGTDAEENPTSILTITGQPTGPSRAVEMTLTDVDGSFWNQYDLIGFDGSALTAPIDQVQVDAYTGGTYDEASDTFTGGTWTDGEPAGAFALPAGVDAADVVGLRFTFTRADGAIWENPANPTQAVNLEVQVRDTLRSDPTTPVPSDLEQNAAAPGEDAPGIATNDVTATVTGADLVFNPDDPETPIPVSSDAEASGMLIYEHTENGVQIVKDFDTDITGGTKPPGAPFPMNITVTNVGNRPIYDPVIIDDPMPTDPDGPQLRLADVDEPFSYALTEPGTPPVGQPNGPQMPTDPTDVTVDQDGNIAGLTFTFPEGTVLEVGQTYTITVQVIFRTTLAANTVVNNTAGVTGDRPWDVCQAQSGDDGSVIDGRLDRDTGACEADADVTPIPSGVLSESKFVKATNDEYPLGIMVDPDQPGSVTPEDCSPNAAGFYAYPCTPIIPPGASETWRIRVDNVGNLPMDKVVVYDRLPVPGDTASDPTSDSPRGSQWRPIADPNNPPDLVNAPAGSTTTFYYTTVQDYCPDDLVDPVNEPTCPDDPETGWAELTPDTTDETYQQITAIKAVIEMGDGNLFQPGSFIALEGTTTTPAEVPEAGDRSIAFNSAAASGVVVTQGGDEINSLRTEGVKVGVATASGPLQVNKIVTGEGAEYAPDSFELTVQCTSAVGSWLETELDPIALTVTPGVPVTVPNLPYGAECTISEDGSNGETELIVGTVTIGEEPDVTSLTAVNLYSLSSIEISKEVVTDAVDQDGTPVPFGPFEATVECTFLGEAVYADGYGPDDPMVVTIEDGETVTFTGLPVNSECTVTETGTGNASSVTVTVGHPTIDPVVTDGPTADLTLLPDVLGEGTNEVTLTNTYDVGAIDLLKVVDGSGAEGFGGGPFEFTVLCTYDDDGDGGADPRTVYDDSITLGGDDPLEATIENLPAGAVCEITETDDGGATSSDLTPNPVTVVAGETTEVTATNTFDLGTVQVDKALAGLGALYGPGPFEVEIACTFEGDPVEVPGGATRVLVPGDPVLYEGLPVGSECTVTETDDFGASSTTMTVDGGTPVDGSAVDVVVPPAEGGEPTAVEVVVTNTFDTAPLAVTKVVDGEGAEFAPPMPDIPDAPTPPADPTPEELAEYLVELEAYLATVPFDEFPYEASLACTFEGQDVPIPGGDARRFGPGFPALYFGLPTGAECTITETDTGGATSVAFDPETVVITDTQDPLTPIPATVTNTYDVGQIAVDKVVDGDGAELYGTGPFEVATTCTFLGEEIEVPGGADRTITPGTPVVYEGLPVGAVCTVTETDDGSATDVTISSAVEGGEAGQAIVPAAGDTTVGITVTNTFDLGEVVVDKVTDGDGAEAWGAGPFEVELACTFNGAEIEIPGGATRSLTPGSSVTFADLPVGAECSVTETDDGGATETSIAPESVTVGGLADDPVGVTVTNTFDLGSVQVDKELAGIGALYGPGPFEVSLACTFNGASIDIPGGAARELQPGAPVVYDGLPVGAECVVTETEDFGATEVEISTTVDDGEPGELVVTGGDEPVGITVTNTFLVSPVLVEKVVDGDAAQFAPPMPDLPELPTTLEELADFDFAAIPFDEMPYQVTAECSFEGAPVPIPGGPSRMFGPGFPAVYFGLPDGTECTFTESMTAGATSVAIDPETVTVDETSLLVEPTVATVTNTYDAGELVVTKVTDGAGAGLWGDGPFEATATCTFLGDEIEIPDGPTRALTPEEPAVFAGLPLGAECDVTESVTGGATSSTVTAADGADGPVVVDADGSAAFEVRNTFDVGQVVVDKTLAGDGADEHVEDVLTVTLACTRDVDGEQVAIDVPGGANRELSAAGDWTAVYADLPQGATCTLAETEAGDARSVTIEAPDGSTTTDPAGGVPTSEAFEVPVAGTSSVGVDVVNTYDAAPVPPTPGPGFLPRTGADVAGASLLALLLLGAGYALVRWRRRSE
ncbi:DUF11 domain-containing protein [Isoptericola sp. S6320L]|uniref:DUF5979 domain-containing protein n=1 Tax=Isoptericola sp. S6320L TaxID=2926411 RepID=UPI001FF14CEA|nr:DUF5979 domain-containing protein [Isoptericola sp. S6320L]MCK0115574.1 DUF11 domain-containing protein [Isoptericola sp. S6320L]